ncbi:MAG: GbsR/MarR family transcriptional regulator [Jatrophihabitans sp.]
MTDDDRAALAAPADDQFVEDMVKQYDFWPPIAARMFAVLLLADGQYQSSRQLMERLHASSGSISNMGRLLIERGYIERAVDPRTRRDLFRSRPNIWTEFQHDSVRRFEQLIALCDKAIEERAEAGGPVVTNLHSMRDYYSFLAKELPLLMSRYESWQTECESTPDLIESTPPAKPPSEQEPKDTYARSGQAKGPHSGVESCAVDRAAYGSEI